jgi:chemotaxis methyl-accepting protein methylase
VPAVAREVAARVAGSIAPGGYLVLGADERLPEGVAGLEAVEGAPGIYASTRADADA